MRRFSAALIFVAVTAQTFAQATNDATHFAIQSYLIEGKPLLAPEIIAPLLAKHTGANVAESDIVNAAVELQSEYLKAGYSQMIIAVAPDRMTNGVLTMSVFSGTSAQIYVSGKLQNPGELIPPTALPANTAVAATISAPAATNAIPHFTVQGYEVHGNSLLSPQTIKNALLKHTGTNATRDDVIAAAKELQLEYHDRGYDTINVTLPPQSLTNGVVQIRVSEGKLVEVVLTGNRYYSSNNILRALPSLKTNIFLNSRVFQAELDRANANQDRQIYPRVSPGPETNTTTLVLQVKDRFPFHAKIELNNEASPGTPDLRVNASAVYGNFWQENHSLGVQYSYSPEEHKIGDQWNFYDQPRVANYSTFYRMPLGAPGSIAEEVASRPGTFGYDEASRKFNLPPPSGAAELNFFASRSTIDTGINLSAPDTLLQSTARTITKGTSQEDLTVNNSLGFRLSTPLADVAGIRSVVSGGFDYKDYNLKSAKEFIYTFNEILHHTLGDAGTTNTGVLLSPVPLTTTQVRYLPLTLRWDGSHPDSQGRFDASLNYSVNFLNTLFANSRTDFQSAAGSTHADGFYHVLNASFSREQILPRAWKLSLRADGQWANQPLISNEQFGDGGVGGVRGYAEGEVFGDTGWRLTSELKTPQHLIGLIGGPKNPFTIRGSVLMDYGETYLLDPQGRSDRTPLWGVGAGFQMNIGPMWQARFLFAFPLEATATTEAGQPRFNFALTAQF